MTKEPVKGIIFDIQRFSIHDGPGIRTTVFLKGCPFRCCWCQNPESINPFPEITYNVEKCIVCDRCIEVCSENAIISEDDVRKKILNDLCTLCGECIDVCYAEALQWTGREITVEELLAEVKRDNLFYQHSNGGITLSGGEPLLQWKFVVNFLKRGKEEGFHQALDTAGYAPWDKLCRVLDFTDLFLYDIKHINSDKHKEFLGIGNELVLKNARQIAAQKIPMIIRVPIIPEFNDSKEEIEEIARFTAELKWIKELHLLPYHSLGKHKFDLLGKTYPMNENSSLTKEKILELKHICESFGLTVRII